MQSLNLSGNQLTALPWSLGQLTQLQSLNLSINRLTALPESLGELTRLRSLYLSNNQLPALPESVGGLTQLQSLYLSNNQLSALPESLGQLAQLQLLDLARNQLMALPESLGQLTQLRTLVLANNQLTALPESLLQLTKLRRLSLSRNRLTKLPMLIGSLTQLEELYITDNQLVDLPPSIVELSVFSAILVSGNPLNSELRATYQEGLAAVKRYLRAKAAAEITLNEAKLILVGEGEVGKSCLLGALRGDAWEEGRPTTHGIEIKPVQMIDTDTKTEITLNGWDFGGQRVYRPTHQLFFSAPAVFLVVWKPREGPQQGLVEEWIQLIVRREPDAKILVVATHGGPQQRQPDIDRQRLWDLFGTETVVDFFHVESRPDDHGERCGIEALKRAIARVAATLPRWCGPCPKASRTRDSLTGNGRGVSAVGACASHLPRARDGR